MFFAKIKNLQLLMKLINDPLSAPSGMTTQKIINDYPAIETDDVKACLAYASGLTRIKSIPKVVA